MNEAIKRKWIQFMAGKRKARGRLRNLVGGHCCLGHLCELFRQETGRGEWKKLAGGWFFCIGPDQRTGILPSAVAEWAGLDSQLPAAIEAGEDLAILNDTQPGYPIEAIEKL